MNKKIFADTKNKIHRYVSEGRLREAFSLARSLSEGNMAWEISDDINSAEESYRRLLSYAVSGAEDPGRDEMTAQLGETVLTITDRIDRLNSAKETPTLYYNTVRSQQAMPSETIQSQLQAYRRFCSENSLMDMISAGTHSNIYLQVTSERERLERSLFNLVWTAFPISNADYESLSAALRDGLMPDYVVTMLAWAISLGGLEFFDYRRLMLLCDLYTDGSERVTAVALLGMLIMMHHWRSRRFPRKLRERFEAVRELPQWQQDIRAAYMELTRTRDTDRITAKIRDEIVPEMMKLRPEMERKFSGAAELSSPEEMEENPEWQDMLEKSGIADKLKEMSEIQEEGGDIMMGTFSHLKQFPFFNELPNWFIPFHSGRSEFADIPGREGLQKIASLFEELKFLCDSDKYSLLMSLSSVPAAQRDMVIGQLNAQAEQLDEMRAASLDLSTTSRREMITREVQNLYRFFRLFRRKGEFYNPFAESVNLVAVPALVDDVKDADLLSLIAEFYFSHHYWQEAIEVFEIVDSITLPSASIYQKMGYSYMKTGRIAEALTSFEKADMLDNRSAWTLARLARCYAMTGQHSSALTAYERLEELRPDQPANSIAMGREHLALGHTTDAINAFYKAFYLDETSGKAIRPLAWSLLIDKQFDQSRKYYEKIITEFDPQPEDYLNMGHLSLATGHYAEAQNFYRLSIISRPRPAGQSWPTVSGREPSDREIPRASIDSFIADMKADTPALSRLGIAPSLIPLISDALLYSLA